MLAINPSHKVSDITHSGLSAVALDVEQQTASSTFASIQYVRMQSVVTRAHNTTSDANNCMRSKLVNALVVVLAAVDMQTSQTAKTLAVVLSCSLLNKRR